MLADVPRTNDQMVRLQVGIAEVAEGERGGAEQAGVVPKRGIPDGQVAPHVDETMLRNRLARMGEQRLANPGNTTADHDHRGIEEVGERADGGSERASRTAHDRRRGRIALLGRSRDDTGVQLTIGSQLSQAITIGGRRHQLGVGGHQPSGECSSASAARSVVDHTSCSSASSETVSVRVVVRRLPYWSELVKRAAYSPAGTSDPDSSRAAQLPQPWIAISRTTCPSASRISRSVPNPPVVPLIQIRSSRPGVVG